MVISLTSFIGTNPPVSGLKTPHRPILNSVPMMTPTNPSSIGGRNFNYRKFWLDYRDNPELMAVIDVITTDVLGDRPKWTKPDGTALGRNTFLEAKRFWQKNRGKETVEAFLRDSAITGDGYIWKAHVKEQDKIKTIKQITSKYAHALSDKELNEFAIKTTQDEDLKKPKAFDYVASSTVTIDNNNFDIEGYTQRSQGLTQHFTPEEIIHMRWHTVNGFVEGFSPVEALTAEIALLWLVKGNMVSIMENGGSPDLAYILPKEIAGGPNHRYMEDVLAKYKSVRQRHGAFVFAGEVDIKEISSKIKDLEYKDLALYITSQIALAFRIPVTRIPYLIGSSATSGDSGGMAEQGYWNMISEIQDKVEDLLNYQLFHQLGYSIQFNRKYKQDEVRESQVFSMNADTITKIQSILKPTGKSLTETKIGQILDIRPDEVRDLEPEEKMDRFEKTGMMNQNLLDNNSVQKEPDSLKRDSTKRNVANQQANKDAAV